MILIALNLFCKSDTRQGFGEMNGLFLNQNPDIVEYMRTENWVLLESSFKKTFFLLPKQLL